MPDIFDQYWSTNQLLARQTSAIDHSKDQGNPWGKLELMFVGFF